VKEDKNRKLYSPKEKSKQYKRSYVQKLCAPSICSSI
jgi:hypothetical protein